MNINLTGNSSISINGQTFTGNNISIINGEVIVDGKAEQHNKGLTGDIHVVVNGDVENLQNGSGSITAQNVGTISSGSGKIKCGDVAGSVKTGSGNVFCGNVNGSVRTGSGDINQYKP